MSYDANANGSGDDPFDAHRQATTRRARDHKRRIDTNQQLREVAGDLLAQRWSPQQIGWHLSETLHDALAARMGDLPPRLLRSITWDQGTEMARHTAIAAKLGTKIYFCDSRSPWQRPSNENTNGNTNGLLRQYFPKETDLRLHPPEHHIAVEDELNRRPRMVLEDRAPIDLFQALLGSPPPPMLQR